MSERPGVGDGADDDSRVRKVGADGDRGSRERAAADGPAVPVVPGLPPLRWTGSASRADIDGESLVLTAKAGVDWNSDAVTGMVVDAARALVFTPPPGDFTLSARVAVESHRTVFDAGALVLHSDRDHWAKLCFESAPDGTPMVVSVVTDRWSDDANHAEAPREGVHLRLSRVGAAVLFHRSLDGDHWGLVRQFRPSATREFSVGFLAQSPTGPGCRARFDGIRLTAESLGEHLRDGC